LTKFCPKCGKDLNEGAIRCIHCGSYLNETQLINESNSAKDWGLGFGVIGFFLGIALFYYDHFFGSGIGGYPIIFGFIFFVIFFIPVYVILSIKNLLVKITNHYRT